jgi:transposase
MQTKVRKIDFSGQPLYIGIDVHLKSWKVTILSNHHEYKTFSQDPNPDILIAHLRNKYPGAIYYAVYEAGFCGFQHQRALQEAGIDCIIVHPVDIPFTSKDRKLKNDVRDSRKLAKSLRSGELEGIYIPGQEQVADRDLVRGRDKVARDITRYKLRVKSMLMFHGIRVPDNISAEQSRHWSRNYIEWLEALDLGHTWLRHSLDCYINCALMLQKQLLGLNKSIRQMAKTPRYKKSCDLLMGIPGIGIISAMTLLTEIGDMRRFKTFDQLALFVGLVPKTNSSGDREVVGKMIRRGRKALKIIIIESAWTAARQDPALAVRYNELCKKMAKNKAIIRIARKLLNRIRRILIYQEEYVIGVV